jgi:hypothetical protein
VPELTAINCTIAYNESNDSNSSDYDFSGGGGLMHSGATLFNTVVALNKDAYTGRPDDVADNPYVDLLSSASAYNLIGTGGSGGLQDQSIDPEHHNQVGIADPGLAVDLADNGGPTQTVALQPGSPAIDNGNNDLIPAGLQLDQRGSGFLRIVNGTVDIGAYEFLPATTAAVSVGWGTQVAYLQTAADGLRLLPAGRKTDLPWLGINEIRVTLSQAQVLTTDEVTVNSAFGLNYGPVLVSGSGTDYTIVLAHPINTADRVTITIVNPGVSMFNRRVDILPGDVNDDGVVNAQDVVLARNAYLKTGDPLMIGWTDLDGDGVVSLTDVTLVRKKLGSRLP